MGQSPPTSGHAGDSASTLQSGAVTDTLKQVRAQTQSSSVFSSPFLFPKT